MNKKAFALIELLVVITVIGILASLLLAAVIGARNKANRIYCVNNLHQVGIGFTEFVSDNGYYPRYGPMITLERSNFWDYALLPYVSGNIRVFHCPSLKDQDDNSNWMFTQHGTTWQAQPNRSYGYNASGTLDDINTFPTTQGLSESFFMPSNFFVRESAVIVPGDMIVTGDQNILYDDDGDGDLHPDLLWGVTLTKERHDNRANVVFCDSHVERASTNVLKSARIRWNNDHQSH